VCLQSLCHKPYILYDGKKTKIKGSALKASTLEPALKEFIKEMINMILKDDKNYMALYMKYVKEIMNLTDIKRWSFRKTLTSKVYSSERTNETKVMDAIGDTEYVEGDRAYFFFKEDESLCLVEKFTGDYNKTKLLKKLHNAGKRFETILPVDELFKNYSLKKNKKELDGI